MLTFPSFSFPELPVAQGTYQEAEDSGESQEGEDKQEGGKAWNYNQDILIDNKGFQSLSDLEGLRDLTADTTLLGDDTEALVKPVLARSPRRTKTPICGGSSPLTPMMDMEMEKVENYVRPVEKLDAGPWLAFFATLK